MNWASEITRLLKIDYPIIQAPMFGVTTPEMVAAALKANCLGSLSLADLSGDQCIEIIRQTKKLTSKAFAVNIFVHKIPEITDALRAKYSNAKRFIEQLARQNNLDVNLPELDDLKLNGYDEQIDAIIAEECKILSFTFGNLDKNSIDKLKNSAVILIGTCTSVSEALALEKSGVDIICVQGWEAGGHRGSFAADNIPQVGGISLLTEVYKRVGVPLIYAGGICNAQTLLASKTLGASAFQIGSLLLASKESALKDFEKERLGCVDESEIVLTNSFSGRYARGIRNTFIDALECTDFVLPYPYQNKLTSALRNVARTQKNAEFVNIWVGQSIHDFSTESTTTIIEKLINETESVFNKTLE